jgi:hypothetical protein
MQESFSSMEKGTEFEGEYEYDFRNGRSIREKGLIEEPGSHSTFELSLVLILAFPFGRRRGEKRYQTLLNLRAIRRNSLH